MTELKGYAPAKVNLFLHVGPVKPNVRHDLDSLVVFADERAADHVTAEAADDLSLTVEGPFAPVSGRVEDNLVLKAAEALRAASGCSKGAKLTLRKCLPVAAGIGGGSSDAAATLRVLTQLWGLPPSYAAQVAPGLGGDVPVSLAAMPSLMRGEGDRVEPAQLSFRIPVLLVNSHAPCPTGPVFAAYDAAGGGRDFAEINPMPGFLDKDHLTDWLHHQRNDLEAPAISLVPEIAEVIDFLNAQPGVRLVRMSGSGATCFGVFDAISLAERASAALKAEKPDWWSVPTRLGAAI